MWNLQDTLSICLRAGRSLAFQHLGSWGALSPVCGVVGVARSQRGDLTGHVEASEQRAQSPAPSLQWSGPEEEPSPRGSVAHSPGLGGSPLSLARLGSWLQPARMLSCSLVLSPARSTGALPLWVKSKFSPKEAAFPFCWRKALFTGMGLCFD